MAWSEIAVEPSSEQGFQKKRPEFSSSATYCNLILASYFTVLIYKMQCYRWNICLPSKCICWNLIPKVMVLGDRACETWWGLESRALMSGTIALLKNNTSKKEKYMVFCHVSTQWEDSYLWTKPSLDTESTGPMILKFPASRTVRNELVALSPPIYSVLSQQPKDINLFLRVLAGWNCLLPPSPSFKKKKSSHSNP